MEEEELFVKVCEPKFTGIHEDVKEILRVLKGKDDQPGLCDRVRDLEKSRANVLKVLGVIGTAVAAQFVAWIKSRI
jgi:hypothetical protein